MNGRNPRKCFVALKTGLKSDETINKSSRCSADRNGRRCRDDRRSNFIQGKPIHGGCCRNSENMWQRSSKGV